jgi:hypothetical protein
MTGHRAPRAQLDLAELPQQLRSAIESILEKGEVEIVRSGEPVGSLAFHSAVLEGVILPPAEESSPDPVLEDEGVRVVATTMRLSDAARARLRDAFGPSYLVLDFADAPPTADVVLTHPVSPQLTHRWTLMFPQARIIVTEILDEELGLDVRGPVGRLMDAGAHAYLPRRPVEQLAQNVHGYLASQDRRELGTSDGTVLEIGPSDEGQP